MTTPVRTTTSTILIRVTDDMEPCLRALLTSVVTIKSVTSYSESGNEVLGVARELRAYVERSTEIVRHPSGGTERQTKTVLVTEIPISPDDRIWLEGEDSNDPTFSRRASEVTVMKHPVTGLIDHYEVML